MNKRIFFIALIFILLMVFTGCGSKVKKTILSDLGGVFSFDESDVNFDKEVSGRLSEDKGNEDIKTFKASYAEGSTIVRSWGIKRNPGNQTPGADPGTPSILKKYGGLYIGDTSKKEIYLTFDEGYENGYTVKILDTLRDNDAKAVFFITGPYLKSHLDLVTRMVKEGHTVGNHTVTHPSLPRIGEKQLEEEVLGLDRAFNEKFGINMKYLRPPKGEYSERTLEITQKLGYRNVFWSFAYDDWYRDRIRGADYAFDIVMRNLHNGEILLLHAVSKDNADALGRIIQGARERGYSIGNIDDIE